MLLSTYYSQVKQLGPSSQLAAAGGVLAAGSSAFGTFGASISPMGKGSKMSSKAAEAKGFVSAASRMHQQQRPANPKKVGQVLSTYLLLSYFLLTRTRQP